MRGIEGGVNESGFGLGRGCGQKGDGIIRRDFTPGFTPGPVPAEGGIGGVPQVRLAGHRAAVAGGPVRGHAGADVLGFIKTEAGFGLDMPFAGEAGPVTGAGHQLGPKPSGSALGIGVFKQAIGAPKRPSRHEHGTAGDADGSAP